MYLVKIGVTPSSIMSVDYVTGNDSQESAFRVKLCDTSIRDTVYNKAKLKQGIIVKPELRILFDIIHVQYMNADIILKVIAEMQMKPCTILQHPASTETDQNSHNTTIDHSRSHNSSQSRNPSRSQDSNRSRGSNQSRDSNRSQDSIRNDSQPRDSS